MTKIKKDTVINAPVETVYGMWRDFQNFPRFMKNIEDVRVTSEKMSHWKATGPLGMSAEWDAEITLDEPNQAIGWRGIEGSSSVITAGKVNFKEAGANQTNLDVTIEYAPPGGALGDIVAKIFSNPDHQVEEDLERFRELVEQSGGMNGSSMNGGSAAQRGGGIPATNADSSMGRDDAADLGVGSAMGLNQSADPDAPLGSSMGTVSENDLAEAAQIGDNGNVPPATSDPLAIGVGEDAQPETKRGHEQAQSDARQAGL